MLASSIPVKFTIPWGNSAVSPYIRAIPTASQIGVQGGAASLTDGFPPLCFSPVIAGGVPPFGEDFNGILQQLTQWCQWFSVGGLVPYDATFSSAIGGYPSGAIVASAVTTGQAFVSTADNNTSNPDTGGANWVPFSYYGTFTTGDVKFTFKTVADVGWILANDGTIGSASSGATYAAANASPLYVLLWNNVSNSFAPVTGGRGANAAADFAANKKLAVPLLLGRALAVAGAGAGLTSRALGQWLGEETHTMTLADLVAHTHQVNAGPGTSVLAASGGGFTFPEGTTTSTLTTTSTGSGTPFNQMQPTTFLNCMIKL